jgi:tRNA-specific 2-thiouridylase
MNNRSKKSRRIAVAMSGGVDSSVAAALLVEAGFDVIGLMLRLWSEPGADSQNRCCTPDAMALARKVAGQLEIPFYPIDAKNVFYNQVVQHFIDDYTSGVTPNPCLRCNRHIRWEFLLDHALAFGATYMATGHYARVQNTADRIQLLKAVDQSKDQSYVLHVLNQHQLSHALFPLGDFTKAEVRKFARDFKLPVAERSDSQDLCFIGDGDYRDFLSRNSNQSINEGEIHDLEGRRIGVHQGLAYYTIGQRRGLGIASENPLYIIEKDIARNILVVGDQNQQSRSKLRAGNVNWVSISPPIEPISASVKIRYKSSEEPALILPRGEEEVDIQFDDPIIGITPGQAAVFYDGNYCLGGGIIQNSVE